MDELTKIFDQLRETVLLLPFVVTILVCINLGAALKWAKFFADSRIPFCLGLVGGVIYPAIAYWFDQDYRATNIPLNVCMGAIGGFSATGIHQTIRQSNRLSNIFILKYLVPPTGNTEIFRRPNDDPHKTGTDTAVSMPTAGPQESRPTADVAQ